MKVRTYQLINAKIVFWVSLLWIGMTTLGVYGWGLVRHHTFFQNALISTSVVALAFFLFITIGLYKGYKLDNLGKVTDKIQFPDSMDLSTLPATSNDSMDVEEGVIGILLSIFIGIIWTIVFSVVFWLVSNLLVGKIAGLLALLYWILFRALRIVFKNGRLCKGKLWESIKMGVVYTGLYCGWNYGIFKLAQFWKR
jgi:hypothetical protein